MNDSDGADDESQSPVNSTAPCTPTRDQTSLSSISRDFTEHSGSGPLFSPTPSVEDLPALDANGCLRWSGKGLSSLPRQKCNELARDGRPVLELDISANKLRSLDCSLLSLDHCVRVNASQNDFSQLRSFHPMSSTLVHLDLTDNRISSLVSVNSFSQLRTLDLSHNRIEQLSSLDNLSHLTSLNLSSNHIRSIPNLAHMNKLTELLLHGNAIRTLEDIRTHLPAKSLRHIDLGGNLLADLTEMHFLHSFLALESLTILGNSYTSAKGGGQFSYRSFVYSCVLGELKILDGNYLSEQEVIKGEWLHAQGRSRIFRPGTNSHNQLCEYLAKECPYSPAQQLPLSDDQSLKNVIQKRREYQRVQSATDESIFYQSALNGTLSNRTITPNSPNKLSTRSVSTATTPTQPPALLKWANNANGHGARDNGRSPIKAPTLFSTKITTSNCLLPSSPFGKGCLTPRNGGLTLTCPSTNGGQQTVLDRSPSADLVTVSSTSTSSSRLSSSTVIISKSEAISAGRDNNVPPPPVITAIRGKGDSPVPPKSMPAKNLPQNQLSSASRVNGRQQQIRQPVGLPSAARPSIFPRPRPTTSVGFRHSPLSQNNLSRAAPKVSSTLVVDSSGAKKKVQGGFRSVLSRKLRRSGATDSSEAIRSQLLHKRMDELVERCSQQTTINIQSVETFQELTERVKQLENSLSEQWLSRELLPMLVPTPTNLECRSDPSGSHNMCVSWENYIPLFNSIDHYEIQLNDEPVQQILGKNRRILVTHKSQGEDLKISLRAVLSKPALRSSLVQSVLSTRKIDNFKFHSNMDDDGKENQQKFQKQQGNRSTKGTD